MEVAKKITLGGINGVRKGFKDIKEATLVGRIYGMANEVEHGETNMGPYCKFKGQFRGVNADGVITAAPICFLVSPADTLLEQAIKEAEGQPVQFGFEFWAIPNASAVLGYEYKVKPMLEAAPSAPMRALEAAIGEKFQPIQSKQLQLTGNTDAEAKAKEAAAKEASEKAEKDAAAEKEAKKHKNGK